MNKIVKFPNRSERLQFSELDAAIMRPPRLTLFCLLAWLWRLLRLPLFLVLYWLRPLVLAAFNLLSFPCLLVFIAGWFTVGDMPQHQPIVWFIGAVSFAAFVGVWLYDAVLLRLAPDGFWLTD